MSEFENITTKELLKSINDPNVQVVDVRPVDYYNGWKVNNEKRGGHIKKARSLPVKWTNYLDWIEIVQSKNILPNNKIIIYSHSMDDSLTVAKTFKEFGYKNLFIYDNFMNEWVLDTSLPMDFLPRFTHLVSANWLRQLIETKKAPEFSNKKVVICHCHYQNPKDYELGHIPTAISVDSNTLESQRTWNRRTPGELKETLEGYGITAETTVIFYGRFSSPDNNDPFPGSNAGHLGAIRCAAIMLYAGVNDVRILNGGLQSWVDAGYGLSTKDEKPTPVSDFGVQIPANPEYFVDIPGAKDILSRPGEANLVSVRSWPEHIGEVSGYNYIQKKGDIPGAIFGNCGSDAYHMENYRNLDHTMREYQEVANSLADVGITPDKQNAFYCGTGWRGSEAFFNAWLMGWPKVAVFDGGWFEWSNDESNPIRTGDPTE